ncbi:MAG: YgiQ family radical SAM protein [Bacteroidales bacterium]|nr:YgiQ family radical SAM protein [Bacteroidales bacterium]MBN2633936.1 YgiQ family radical SAM protein [Bacteroidales bacterium]
MKLNPESVSGWLPTSVKEMEALGWDEPDVILFSGDAYIDHPSFGPAVIARVMEDEGFRVAIVPQPNWRDDLRDFKKFGKPGYFFGVTAGNMDSMVNHYTAAKRLRSDDAYSPGGKAGFRPDYPTIVYTRILKQLYPDVPVVAGGIEASMRRLTHYDYWKDRLEPSILTTSGADLLIYGMGEQPLRELIRLLQKGIPFKSLRTLPQTAFFAPGDQPLPRVKAWHDIELHSYEQCCTSKKAFSDNFVHFEKESNRIRSAARLTEPSGNGKVIVNPPFPPMTEAEFDRSFDLPYKYMPHPRYLKKDPVPAYEMIKFSVNLHRGCFGGCSFCAIAAHQGKQVVSRSKRSVMQEISKIIQHPEFRGVITDLGGPSANMYRMSGQDKEMCLKCSRPSCIWPSVCRNLDTDHGALLSLYKTVRNIPGIKKAFVGSGVRYDLFLPESNPAAGRTEKEYFEELVKHHVSGRLKVAPEHTDAQVLKLMRKVSFDLFRKLKVRFDEIIKRENLNYGIVPYFISSHPGSDEEGMKRLADEVRSLGVKPEQVQDFTPTPMTLSTVIYYTGFDPYTGRKVYVARDPGEKKRQKEYFFWYRQKTNRFRRK